VIKLQPENQSAYYNIGWTLSKEDMFEESIEYYKKAAEIDPNFKEAWNGLAWACNEQQRFEETVEYALKAIELDPEYKETWDTLACGYFGLEEYDKAWDAFQKAKELDPDFAGTVEVYEQVKSILDAKEEDVTLSDEEVEQIAVGIAKTRKDRRVSLLQVATNSGMSLEEISRIFSNSKLGNIETYGTEALEDDVFIYSAKVEEKEKEKERDLLTFLTTTDEISIADLSSLAEMDRITVYKHVCSCIARGYCHGRLVGGLTGKFVRISIQETTAGVFGSDHPTAAPTAKSTGMLGGMASGGVTIKVEAGGTFVYGGDVTQAGGDVITAKEVATKEKEHIEIRTHTEVIPKEILEMLKNSADAYRDLKEERQRLFDEIDRLEDEKRNLRRKLDKSDEETAHLNAVMNKLDELSQKLDSHDKEMKNGLQELQSNIWKAASQTIDTVSMKLEEQHAKLALEVIKGNRTLFELIEATSIALKSDLEVQKDQLEQISNMVELSNEHLGNLLEVLDGRSDETKASLKDKILDVLQEAGGEAAEHRGEIEGLLNEVLNKKADKGGRLSALKNFFGKAKNWIQKHPKVVMALRIMLTGAMTAMGVPIPII
jgi:hypothetical protein